MVEYQKQAKFESNIVSITMGVQGQIAAVHRRPWAEGRFQRKMKGYICLTLPVSFPETESLKEQCSYQFEENQNIISYPSYFCIEFCGFGMIVQQIETIAL